MVLKSWCYLLELNTKTNSSSKIDSSGTGGKGDDLKTIMAGRKIFDCGVYLNSVMYPAVPKNRGILRISLNSIPSAQEIETLLSAFTQLAPDILTKKSKITSPFKSLFQIGKSHIQGDNYSGL